MMHNRLTTATLVACCAALAAAGPASAGFLFLDPANVKTADLNTVGKAFGSQVGNATLDQVNAINDKYVFDFESPNTGSNANFQNFDPGVIQITAAAGNVDFSATFRDGPGFGVFSTSATYSSSGTGYLATNNLVDIDTQAVFTGVAFTINRLQGDLQITLLDTTASVIGGGPFNVSGTTTADPATDDVFFAYLGGPSGPAIDAIRIRVINDADGLISQYGLDDFTFTNAPVPEPAAAGLAAAGLLLALRRRRSV
jgi:MYXO-CTERM domain-containing protein